MYFTSAIHEALFSDTVNEQGIGSMILARRTEGGMIVGVVFLCDQYCLGVKDCFAFFETAAGYQQLVSGIREHERLRRVDAGTIKTYVLDLVDWAKAIGFQPAAGFRYCTGIFQGIQEDPAVKFQYGREGIPFYINGPNDTPAIIAEIVRKLTAYQQRTGEQAHYTIGGPAVTQLPVEIATAPHRALE